MNKESLSLKIHGKSMSPLLRDEDDVEVLYYSQPKNIQEIQIGKVVLLREQKEWIIHRVVESSQELKTKGDWSINTDQDNRAWGEVISVNGKKKSLLQSTKMSFLSSQISIEKKRIVRQYYRSLMFLYVYFINLFETDK